MARYRQGSEQGKRAKKPLNASQLRDLALSYVASYATSSAKLERYLARKLHERGWDENEDLQPDIPALVSRYTELGYIDDEGFARSKSASLMRRGYGKRRIEQVLGQDGISANIREDVAASAADLRHAALALAQKRRFGPYGTQPPDTVRREKQVAAMLRAGHNLDSARKLVDAPTVKAAEKWAHELDKDGFA